MHLVRKAMVECWKAAEQGESSEHHSGDTLKQ